MRKHRMDKTSCIKRTLYLIFPDIRRGHLCSEQQQKNPKHSTCSRKSYDRLYLRTAMILLSSISRLYNETRPITRLWKSIEIYETAVDKRQTSAFPLGLIMKNTTLKLSPSVFYSISVTHILSLLGESSSCYILLVQSAGCFSEKTQFS